VSRNDGRRSDELRGATDPPKADVLDGESKLRVAAGDVHDHPGRSLSPDLREQLGRPCEGVTEDQLLRASAACPGLDEEQRGDLSLAVGELLPRGPAVGHDAAVELDERAVASQVGMVDMGVVVVHVRHRAELSIAVEGAGGRRDTGHGGVVLRAPVGPEDEIVERGRLVHLSPPA